MLGANAGTALLHSGATLRRHGRPREPPFGFTQGRPPAASHKLSSAPSASLRSNPQRRCAPLWNPHFIGINGAARAALRKCACGAFINLRNPRIVLLRALGRSSVQQHTKRASAPQAGACAAGRPSGTTSERRKRIWAGLPHVWITPGLRRVSPSFGREGAA